MKGNKYKCHLIVSDNRHVSIKIDCIEIENRECQKLYGIKSDLKLNFKDHLDEVIKKISRKVCFLLRYTLHEYC